MPLLFSGTQEVYLEIAERTRSYIRRGIYREGDRLPSVREAAAELSVNPGTVARAYALLESEGYLRTLPKKGVYVIYSGENEGARAIPDKFRSAVTEMRDAGVNKEMLHTWIEEVYFT